MTELEPHFIVAFVARILDELRIPYVIGGSLASTTDGDPPSLVDISFLVDLSEEAVPELASRLATAFYVSEPGLRRGVRDRSSTSLFHRDTSITIDMFVAGGAPLDAEQVASRPVEIAGRTLSLHPPEDILLQKLRWFRDGGEVSDRQWRDILRFIRARGRRLDREYLATNAPLREVSTLLERAMRDAEASPQNERSL